MTKRGVVNLRSFSQRVTDESCWRFTLGLLLLLSSFSVSTAAPLQDHRDHKLGTVNFPVTCSEPAQQEFNTAVALLHHMTYPQARKAFEQVAATDAKCAMAYWGTAVTLFQPLWPTRPGPEALRRGWEATQKAKALQPATARERLFIEAAEAFFLEPESRDYWLRIRRWERAMQKVYEAFPNDPEANVFYALAHLATTPTDKISRVHADRAAEILVGVYRQHPDHPGVMHYLVHANDVPGRERELLEVTRRYDTVAPENPHALHMPTHIYVRIGEWDAVIHGNMRAAEAALKYPAGDKGEFVWDEFPHAIEYLVYGYLQKGADRKAKAELARLRATKRLEPTFKTAFHLASTQARNVLERRAWNEAMLLVPRQPADLDWDRFTWPEAIVQFARGLGAAHLGRVSDAKNAIKRLEELQQLTDSAGEKLFARNIEILRLELSAWVAHFDGQAATSVSLIKEAAELETSTPKDPVTPGPTLPAHELLGDLFMQQKQPGEAFDAYKQALALYPKRFNSLLGAARAARATNNTSLAHTYYQQLLDISKGGLRHLAMKEARKYLTRTRRSR